jgi:hypothetical protein
LPDQFSHMLIDQLQITAGKSIFDLDVASLDPSQIAHAGRRTDAN